MALKILCPSRMAQSWMGRGSAKPNILSISQKMKQDRFLLIILTGIVLLAVTAVAIFIQRQNSQKYVLDATPEGVLRNYILAVHQGDYTKAFSYMQKLGEKPDLDDFEQRLSKKTSVINRTTLKIVNVDIGEHEAEIEVIISREGADPFANRYSTRETITLVLQAGDWKLTRMPYPFGY